DGRLDDVLHLADIDAVARCRFAVRLDIEIQAARHLLGIDIAGAFHCSHGVGDFTSFRFKFYQVGPKDLDANLGPNARREHVDAVDDRLRPDISHTRYGNSAVHCAFEL